VPRDEAERRKRTTDQPVHDVGPLDGSVAGEEDRHERAELGRDRQCPQRDP
jgi:hypothetical protein